MEFDFNKIDNEIWKYFEREIPNIKKWDKTVEADLIRVVVEENLKQVRGCLAELGEKIKIGEIKIEEGRKEIERLENGLKNGGDLSEGISDRAIIEVETFRKEYLKRGGKVSWTYWYSIELLPFIVSWWRKHILGDQAIRIGMLRGRRGNKILK